MKLSLLLWKNYKSSFTGTFKQVKAEVLERKTLIFLKPAGEIAGFV
jgi:hypothetical protein